MQADQFSSAPGERTIGSQTATPFLVVTCTIGGDEYGLPISEVREIVSMPALLTLAGAPPYLRGLLNLRGQFLPILDGRVLVGADAPILVSNQVLILGGASPQFGLIVDQAQMVRPVTVACSTTLPRDAALPILGDVLEGGDRPALLLDVNALRPLLPPAPTPDAA
jgi:purine-binding chemotaxis protein CheW